MSRLKLCVCVVFSIANFLFRMKYIMVTKTSSKLKFSLANGQKKRQCLKVNVKAISKAYKPVLNFNFNFKIFHHIGYYYIAQ